MSLSLSTPFTRQVGVRYPIICGAMYPCSNPELVAAASKAGAIGIVQPLSLVYVHGLDLRQGLQLVSKMAGWAPYGFNVILESSSSLYEERMRKWVDIALEEGCRFFITALGNPRWVVEKVRPYGGIVYHDVTTRDWALKALDKQVDGLICVNNRAGGHLGALSPEEMFQTLGSLGVPLICAGGVGDRDTFRRMLEIGYSGVQMGTRFIASTECQEKDNYKNAILAATEHDIVATNRVTGIPLSVINTPYVQKMGTQTGAIASYLLQHRHTKRWMRLWYQLRAIHSFRRISLQGGSSRDYWQAGKSVAGIHSVEPVAKIIESFVS